MKFSKDMFKSKHNCISSVKLGPLLLLTGSEREKSSNAAVRSFHKHATNSTNLTYILLRDVSETRSCLLLYMLPKEKFPVIIIKSENNNFLLCVNRGYRKNM